MNLGHKAKGHLLFLLLDISGKAVTIAVTPTMITTNDGAKRRFPPVRRQCYFEEEIDLLHFPPEEGYRFVHQYLTVQVGLGFGVRPLL